ncbi:MAG: hypothetical protein N2C14_06275 [Planctomycetales bacterium]
MRDSITCSHRLVTLGDANHRETLYAGSLLRIALEAGYASGVQAVGDDANLVLRRVISLECRIPVPVGKLIEIQAAPLFAARAYLAIGLIGTPLRSGQGPWMDGLMGFAQIDEDGRAAAFPDDISLCSSEDPQWQALRKRFADFQRLRNNHTRNRAAARS